MTENTWHSSVERALTLAAEQASLTSQPVHIATGGSSIVFVASRQFAPPAVVKVLDFAQIETERLAIAKNSLRREARVLEEATSDHLPRLLNSQPDAGFIVREHVDGEVIQDLLKARTLQLEDRLDLCRRVLDAAISLFSQFHDWADGARVIRDFKPRNLVARHGGGAVVLVDVGGVRAECAMLSRRRRRQRIGTGSWRYWPPEQLLEDDCELDRRVDYFALGSTLFAILFGSPPYLNRSDGAALRTDYALRHQILVSHIRAAPGIPVGLADVIVECTRPAPANRPFSVRSLAAATKA